MPQVQRVWAEVSGTWQIPKRDPGYGHWRLTAIRLADPQWRIGVNRIMGYRIGWYVVLGRQFYGICKPESLNTQRERAVKKMARRG